MVNGVSGYNQYAMNTAGGFYRAAAGTAVLHGKELENMVKFLNGQPLQSIEDPTIGQTVKDTIPMLAIFGGINAISPLKKHKWNVKETIKDVNVASAYKTRGQAIASGKDRIISEYGNFFKKNVAVDTTNRNFLGRMLDRIPGYKTVRATGVGQAMGKSGAGWMLVMDGVMKTFTDVVPTFQNLGFGSGMKQIAKTGTQVAAGAAGWLAGDVVGKGIGAAIGTAICPGIGTAIGGFVGGFLGGMVGSAITAKGAKAITGKNEMEKYQDAQTAQAVQQIQADPNSVSAVAQQALTNAEQILAQDPQNKDAIAIKEAAQKVIAETQTAKPAEDNNQIYAQNADNTQNKNVQSFQGIPPVPGFNGRSYDMNELNQAMAKVSIPYMNPNMQQANIFAQPQMLPTA